MSPQFSQHDIVVAKQDIAVAKAFNAAAKPQSWRELILAGYLPYWSWRHWRFDWQRSSK